MDSLRARVHLCTNCGAPVSSPAQGSVAACEFCGAEVRFGIEPSGPIRFIDPRQALGLSPEKMEAARLASLKKQAEHYDTSSNPYCYIEAPDDLEYISATDELSEEFLPMALQAFNVAVGRCQKSGGGMQEQRRVFWIARKLKNSWTRRDEPLKARAVLETAYDLLQDPGYRQMLMCTLADLARKEGNLALAEEWLGMCDPRPPLLDIDSDYRTSRALLCIAEEKWATALALVGEHRGMIPYEPSNVVVFNGVRVACLEKLGRGPEALENMRFIVEASSLEFAESVFASSTAWAPAYAVLGRLRSLGEIRESTPGGDDSERISEPEVKVPEAIGGWFVGIMVVPLAFGAVALCSSIDDRNRAERMAGWKSTPGETVKIGFRIEGSGDDVSIYPKVVYAYNVDGVRHTNDYIGMNVDSMSSTVDAEAEADRWNRPDLQVYYDPANPSESALDVSPDPDAPIIFVIGVILGVVFVVLLTIFVGSHVRRHAALRAARGRLR